MNYIFKKDLHHFGGKAPTARTQNYIESNVVIDELQIHTA